MCARGREMYAFAKNLWHHWYDEKDKIDDCTWSVCQEWRNYSDLDKMVIIQGEVISIEDTKDCQAAQPLQVEGFGSVHLGFVNIPPTTTRLHHINQKRFTNPIHPSLLFPAKEPPPSTHETLPPTYRLPLPCHRMVNMLH
jgi:hypothetical protein